MAGEMATFQQLAGAIYFRMFANSRANNQSQRYPLIKSPLLRRTAEYVASVLLVATIVLALTTSEPVAMVSLGAFLMVGAFAVSGIRGAFAYKSPWIPVRPAGRIAIFCVGVLSLLLGTIRLLHR
jgi:hypothetical protein